jgi:hypothetical protein
VTEPDGSVEWRIWALPPVADVLALAASGAAITSEQVVGWFQQASRRWPVPSEDEAMAAFLHVLNVLRVTQPFQGKQAEQEDPRRAEGMERIRRVKAAIETLVADLPVMVEAAGTNIAADRAKGRTPLRDEEQIMRLAVLLEQAKAARGVVMAPEPRHKAQPWHDAAMLIGWHVSRILARHGVDTVGTGWTGPLGHVVSLALEAVGEGVHDRAAVAKALDRAGKSSKRGLPRLALHNASYPGALVA